jgi:hypothetical protein
LSLGAFLGLTALRLFLRARRTCSLVCKLNGGIAVSLAQPRRCTSRSRLGGCPGSYSRYCSHREPVVRSRGAHSID